MRELVLNCQESQAEALSDALLDAGVLSVSVEDADSDTDAEQALFGEPGLEPKVQAWRRNRIVALLPEDLDPAQLLEQVQAQAGLGADLGDWAVREVPQTDWVKLTQSQFGPIHIGKRIWIVPSWHSNDPAVPDQRPTRDGGADALHIQLDPGLAFGTGSHPTTHLCLEWLESQLELGLSVLDYGCGSGILAIAAKLLGAGLTTGVDIDPQAVLSSKYNAQVNRVELNAMLPDELAPGQFNVVIANILSNPLKVLAPMLANRVAPEGFLVLSGVLERQAEELIQVYAPWLAMQVWRSREGWVCLAGQRG